MRHGEARYESGYDSSYEGRFTFHGGPGIPQDIWRNLQERRGEVGEGSGRQGDRAGCSRCPNLLKAAH